MTSIIQPFDKKNFKNIPLCPGVYQFYDKQDALLYIGKSICLQKRVKSYFTGAAEGKLERLRRQIHTIKWQTTAGELGALLLEARLIKQQFPIFNRLLRKHKILFAIQLLKESDYYRLQITPYRPILLGSEEVSGLYRHKRKAISALTYLVKNYQLCAKLNGLENVRTNHACFGYQLRNCYGACVNKEEPAEYNKRLMKAIKHRLYRAWPYPGKVAIREHNKFTNTTDYHLIHEWSYYATFNSLAGLEAANVAMHNFNFDLDIYRLLVNYLLIDHPTLDNVIEL